MSLYNGKPLGWKSWFKAQTRTPRRRFKRFITGTTRYTKRQRARANRQSTYSYSR